MHLYGVEFTFHWFVKKRFINSSVRSQVERDFLFVLFNLPDFDIKVHSRLEKGHEGLIGRRIQRNSIAGTTLE